MEIDPTQNQEKQTGKMVIACAIDPVTKKPYPLTVDPITGMLKTSGGGGGGGALIPMGPWDASTELYPENPQVAQFWWITVPGELGGVDYQTGDWLVYVADLTWKKIDNTETGKVKVQEFDIPKFLDVKLQSGKGVSVEKIWFGPESILTTNIDSLSMSAYVSDTFGDDAKGDLRFPFKTLQAAINWLDANYPTIPTFVVIDTDMGSISPNITIPVGMDVTIISPSLYNIWLNELTVDEYCAVKLINIGVSTLVEQPSVTPVEKYVAMSGGLLGAISPSANKGIYLELYGTYTSLTHAEILAGVDDYFGTPIKTTGDGKAVISTFGLPTEDDHLANKGYVDSLVNPFDGDHASLSNVSSDQHHDKSHAHDGVDGSGTVDYADLTNKPALFDGAHDSLSGVSSDQHHDKSHAHDGVDGSGTVDYPDLTNIPTSFPPDAHKHEGKGDILSTSEVAGLALISQGGVNEDADWEKVKIVDLNSQLYPDGALPASDGAGGVDVAMRYSTSILQIAPMGLAFGSNINGFFAWSHSSTYTSVESRAQARVHKLKVTRLNINVGSYSGTVTITVRKNGANTTLTKTINATGQISVVDDIDFADGDLMSVSLTTGPGADLTVYGVQLQIKAEVV